MNEKMDDRRENLKSGFDEWLKDRKLEDGYLDGSVDLVLGDIGINVDSIYEINDSQHVRLYASELVMKRPLCAQVEFTSYSKCIDRLLAYAEYLDHPEKLNVKIQEQDAKPDDHSRNEVVIDENSKLGVSLTVAYYLSRVNKKALQELGYKSFNDAFKDIAGKLGQKPATIKNMRDEFDPYFDNGRRGWYQRELKASRKDIFEINKNLTDDELTKKVKKMLTTFSGGNTAEESFAADIPDPEHDENESDRVKLKIDPSNYKAIKYNKKRSG